MMVTMAGDRGSVRFHRNGWEIRLQAEGRRITRRVKGADDRAGRRAAEDALERLTGELAIGVDRMTVGQLLDQYELAKGPDWSPSTRLSHTTHVKPVREAYGAVEVAKLTGPAIEATNGRWRSSGSSAATVRRRHSILAAALGYAERWGIIAVSPARNVDLPKVDRRIPALDDASHVLAAIEKLGHPGIRIAARLAVATGARRGELLGLRWGDLDLKAGAITITRAVARSEGRDLVYKGTKSGGTKVMAIDAGTVAELVTWRAKLRSQALAAGTTRPGPRTPVLPSPSDPTAPWHPEHLTRCWITNRKLVGLDGMRFHDLRHLHATTLLAAGVPVATVAARLGHASSKMTFDVYSHAIPAQDQAAADVIGRAGQS